MTQPTFDLSVIVPTCDMAAHLPALARALGTSGLLDAVREVIFVDDGSRDDTPAVLERLVTELSADHPGRARVVTLPKNEGRYLARLRGAREARAGHLLFLDTRVSPPAGFVDALAGVFHHGSASVVIRIDVTKSVFNLYWERTHAFLFARNRRDEAAGFFITPETYERYVTGTGGLLCRQDEFLRACAIFGDRALASDDTFLLRELVQLRPIYVQAAWFVQWEPRQSLGAFLKRLWDRGPGFVEYHVVAKPGVYFDVLRVAAAYLVLSLILKNAYMLAAIPIVLLLSTATFARGPLEFVKLAPLHLLTCVAAAAGVGHGLVRLTVFRRSDGRP